jgi:hypothetical protein
MEQALVLWFVSVIVWPVKPPAPTSLFTDAARSGAVQVPTPAVGGRTEVVDVEISVVDRVVVVGTEWSEEVGGGSDVGFFEPLPDVVNALVPKVTASMRRITPKVHATADRPDKPKRRVAIRRPLAARAADEVAEALLAITSSAVTSERV